MSAVTLLKRTLLVTLGCAVILLSGCLRTYDIISTEFPQAQKHEPSYATIKKYLRSLTLYEGFETRAQFDMLWMSDDIRSMYAALHSAKVGDSEQARDAFLVRNLEENNHHITFYVLSEVHDESHISLSDKNSAWSMHLVCADGTKVAPLEVKEIDLDPEIRFLFGHRFALFKKSYRIQFLAKDLIGQPFLAPSDSFSMVCAGTGMSGTLSWHVPFLQQQSVLQKKYALKDKHKGGIFGAFAQFSKPKQRDDDFFW